MRTILTLTVLALIPAGGVAFVRPEKAGSRNGGLTHAPAW
jgi:hypothetical protein